MPKRGQVDRWRELRDLLFEWDPLGVADVRAHAHDEYDCVIDPLTNLLRRDATQEEIVAFLNEMLSDHFGVNPTSGPLLDRTKALAANVAEWRRKRIG